MTIGKFETLFKAQSAFQSKVTGEQVPVDNVRWFSYHMQGMMEELGEVLKADKRWKTHRNEAFDPENKLDELADVFITAINMAIFSGVDANKILDAVAIKIRENGLKWDAKERMYDSYS
jgi:NTP pyrophosphatase (non-canonical NTP hydrolase)